MDERTSYRSAAERTGLSRSAFERALRALREREGRDLLGSPTTAEVDAISGAIRDGSPTAPRRARAGFSRAQAADRIGVSVGRVAQLVRSGALRHLPDGSIDPDSVEAARSARVRARADRASADALSAADCGRVASVLDQIDHSCVEAAVLAARYDMASTPPCRRSIDEVAHAVGISPITAVDILRLVSIRVGGLPGEPPPKRRRTPRRR